MFGYTAYMHIPYTYTYILILYSHKYLYGSWVPDILYKIKQALPNMEYLDIRLVVTLILSDVVTGLCKGIGGFGLVVVKADYNITKFDSPPIFLLVDFYCSALI